MASGTATPCVWSNASPASNAKTIQWEVTIDDPKTYTQPFKMALPIRLQNDYQVFEYACHEGNYGMRNILSAARADEGGAK